MAVRERGRGVRGGSEGDGSESGRVDESENGSEDESESGSESSRLEDGSEDESESGDMRMRERSEAGEMTLKIL